MTEIRKYVADDGTEFDDEQDCQEYELQKIFDALISDKCLCAYQENGAPITKINLLDYSLYIAVKNRAEEVDQFFYAIEKFFGFSMPRLTVADNFYYDYRCNQWLSFKEYKSQYLLMQSLFEPS